MLVRIIFAIIVGVLVTAVLEWLTPIPRSIDILAGILVGVLVYWQYPTSHPL